MWDTPDDGCNFMVISREASKAIDEKRTNDSVNLLVKVMFNGRWMEASFLSTDKVS